MLLTILLGAALAVTPSRSERAAIFKAAGFVPTTGQYLMCDKQTPSGSRCATSMATDGSTRS